MLLLLLQSQRGMQTQQDMPSNCPITDSYQNQMRPFQ